MEDIKRAGDVVGTPDWQLDLMIENHNATIWEMLNTEPPTALDAVSNDKRLKARVVIGSALKLEDLGEKILQAHKIVKNTPQGDKLLSLFDQYIDLKYDLYKVGEEIWRMDR